MLPMSNPNVEPGATENQQMRVVAPVGVRPLNISSSLPANTWSSRFQSNVRLRLRIGFTVDGQAHQEQVDFAGFPAGLTGGAS